MRRENRLRSARDFRRAFEEGRRASAPGLICFAAAGPDATGPPRVGVTASRKVGGATERNRVKRLLREAARRALPGLPEGTDVVLVATRVLVGKDFQYVAEQVEALVKRLGP